MYHDDYSNQQPALTLVSRSVADTQKLGAQLGQLLSSGDIVCLSGQLGAGKTYLTRGIAMGWGTRDPVSSPTFTLVNQYTHPEKEAFLYHLDAYRLSGPLEAQTIALDDLIDSNGVLVIEWPERIAAALPTKRLWIQLSDTGEETRQISFYPAGERATGLVDELRVVAQ